MKPGTPVEIDYRRAGGERVTYRQRLVHAGDDVVVTLLAETPIATPKRVGGRVILEPGSPVVWFTFPGAWHDIGIFHTADGVRTGIYANLLTPVHLAPPTERVWRWTTTDLCLDLWIGSDVAEACLLDQDEFDRAVSTGEIDALTAARARREGDRLLAAARRDEWPPAVVGEWPLERAIETVRRGAARRGRP
ncbi:MAG: DUF402 domain-containing protein [Longimicrobiales bacterium]|nr:DUF402 domain-containing protein [Longimicrobiales bacterium]